MMNTECKGKNRVAISVAIFILASMGTAISNAGSPSAAVKSPDISVVKENAKRYMESLKTLLQQKMSESGPIAALAVCSRDAVHLSAEISRETGWSIRRVSDRARNPLAMPDEYESIMLDTFAKKIATQPNIPSVINYEVVEEHGVHYARFMQGIRIQPVCLTCHGDKAQISAVNEKLTELYPHDTARGYKVGDLRGALSIKIKLD